jgi:hypothetical protein
MNLMLRGTLSLLLAGCIALAADEPNASVTAADQDQTPAAAAPAPAPAPEPQKAVNNFTWKGIKLSGVLDGYLEHNYNKPASGKNATRAFDTEHDKVDLNMLKFAIEKDPAPVGFRLDLGLGRAFDVFQFFEPTRRVEQLLPVMQGYLSVKPKAWNGLQIDVGKFYTWAGGELTETHLNFNYSRGLLYNNGPFFHFGIRGTKPIGKNFTAGVALLNGWNNVADQNSGKTLGFTGIYTKGKVTWAQTYYVGPEKFKLNKGYRNFYDTVVAINTSDKNSLFTNFDYGVERGVGGEKGAKFAAISFADRYAITSHVAVSGRYEWYNDAQGFITGQAQKLQSFTLTGEYKFFDGLLTRLEFRRDISNEPFFDRRAGLTNIKSQNTLLIGLVGYFGPKS